MVLYFRNFLYLLCAFVCAAKFAFASDTDSDNGLKDENMMTPAPVAVSACYMDYDCLIDPKNLATEIKSFEKFNLQRDPWLGFAMRFNAVLDIIIKKNNREMFDLLKSAVAIPYSEFMKDDPKRNDYMLSVLSFKRYNNWHEVL